MADVVFENVTKRFGRATAVENLTLEIEDGEFVVLSARPARARLRPCAWPAAWRCPTTAAS